MEYGCGDYSWCNRCPLPRTRLFIMEKRKNFAPHQYHYDKVSEEDKKAFCAVSGKGVTVMGAGSLISGMLVGITGSKWSMIAFSVGFLVGLGMLIYAGIRYNQ